MHKKFVTPPVWGARKRRPDIYAIHEYMNVRLPYSCIYLFSDVIKETQSLFSVAAWKQTESENCNNNKIKTCLYMWYVVFIWSFTCIIIIITTTTTTKALTTTQSKIAEVTVIPFTSKFLKVKVIFSFSATSSGVILAEIMLVLRCLLKEGFKLLQDSNRNLNVVYQKRKKQNQFLTSRQIQFFME